jgi:hypothetical protein
MFEPFAVAAAVAVEVVPLGALTVSPTVFGGSVWTTFSDPPLPEGDVVA